MSSKGATEPRLAGRRTASGARLKPDVRSHYGRPRAVGNRWVVCGHRRSAVRRSTFVRVRPDRRCKVSRSSEIFVCVVLLRGVREPLGEPALWRVMVPENKRISVHHVLVRHDRDDYRLRHFDCSGTLRRACQTHGGASGRGVVPQ